LLFSKPGRWTQKVCARDRRGKPVPVFSQEARAFDIEGAIRRAAGKDDRGAYAPSMQLVRIITPVLTKWLNC
jgi:hypothetical protein